MAEDTVLASRCIAKAEAGRKASEMPGRAARSRHVRSRAAFCGVFFTMMCIYIAQSCRVPCKLPFGCLWCGPGMCSTRRNWRSAHSCWAHRRRRQSPSSRCMSLCDGHKRNQSAGCQLLARLPLFPRPLIFCAMARLGRAAGGCDRPPHWFQPFLLCLLIAPIA